MTTNQMGVHGKQKENKDKKNEAKINGTAPS
jgi:hypothetical protein